MSDSDKIKHHLAAFYGENPDFGEDGGIHDKWAWLDFKFFRIPFPNPKSRSEILYLHDINHLVNQYDTSWQGEASVSAWEVSSGLGRFVTGWFFALLGMGIGLFFYPKKVYTAFLRGQITLSIFSMDIPKAEIMEMTLKELKVKTRHHQLDNIVQKPSIIIKLKFIYYALLSTLIILLPIFIGLMVFFHFAF